MIEYTYENGHKMISQCRHIRNASNDVSEHVHGTKGYANISRGKIYSKSGELIFQTKAKRGGHQQEHHNLFANIRDGILPNEGEYGAKSTMTAILGRLATYTGRDLKWEDAINSNISLCDVDAIEDFQSEPPLFPNDKGAYWVPMPGKELKKTIDF